VHRSAFILAALHPVDPRAVAGATTRDSPDPTGEPEREGFVEGTDGAIRPARRDEGDDGMFDEDRAGVTMCDTPCPDGKP
jgi:hypothetical protein